MRERCGRDVKHVGCPPPVASFGASSCINATDETLCTAGTPPPRRRLEPVLAFSSWAAPTISWGRGSASRSSHTHTLPSRPPLAKTLALRGETDFTEARWPRKRRISISVRTS